MAAGGLALPCSSLVRMRLRSASACCAGVKRLGRLEPLLRSSLLCKIKLLVKIFRCADNVHPVRKTAGRKQLYHMIASHSIVQH